MNPNVAIHGLIRQALFLQQKGDSSQAESLYKAVLELDPREPNALHFLGMIEADRDRNDVAAQYIRAALASNGSMPAAYVNLGMVLRRMGRLDEAVTCYDKAIDLEPGLALAHFNRGNALRDLGRAEEAFKSFIRAAELEPHDPDAFNNCGSILWKVGKYAEALEYFERALSLDPTHVDASINKASVFEKTGRQVEALDIYDDILARYPGHVVALVNRGGILEAWGQVTEALSCFREAQLYAPEDKGANLNEAFCLLKLGDFRDGWRKYEWRFHGEQEQPTRVFSVPRWAGEALSGKTILLHEEQGFGDTLQFCRYAKKLAQGGATVVMESPDALVNTLKSLAGISAVVRSGDGLPHVDVHAPLMSVPFLLGEDGIPVPCEVPYLHAPEQKRAYWKHALLGYEEIRVAIVWGTTTKQQEKAIPLVEFSTLFQSPAHFFVAQKVVSDDERQLLNPYDNVTVLSDDLHDFSDTAGLLSAVDITITIDTSVAHLAGAMALPVWVLLHEAVDWRWMLEREDSEWYPSAKLFRRKRGQSWSPVLEAVRTQLGALANRRSNASTGASLLAAAAGEVASAKNQVVAVDEFRLLDVTQQSLNL